MLQVIPGNIQEQPLDCSKHNGELLEAGGAGLLRQAILGGGAGRGPTRAAHFVGGHPRSWSNHQA